MELVNLTTRHSNRSRESDLLRLLMTRSMSTDSSSPDQGFIRKVSFENEDVDVAVKSPRGLDVFDSVRLSAHSTKEENKVSYPRDAIVEPDSSGFWESNIAVKLFCPEPNETPVDAVNKMIDILERATTHPKNCWSIVKGSRSDLRMLKDEDLYRVYTKAVYIKEALYLSRSTINEGKPFSFRKCCNQVVQIVGEQVKPHHITAGYTVGEWFRDFRRGRAFTHYKCCQTSWQQQQLAPLQNFFDDEPDLCKLFKFQLVSNLSGMSAKKALHMFSKNIIPMASSKRRCPPEDVILEYGLDSLHQMDFHEWLKNQDFVDTVCSDSGSIVWTYMETVDM
mmetsp:Transcript_23123/g.57016  ORF Transcript_23123/g.57016 Transcript_23123/m.57016 type:complete len:336 (-) Transcript_23123:46-1053(-)